MEAEGESRTGRVQEEILPCSDHVLPGQHPVAEQHRQVGQLEICLWKGSLNSAWQVRTSL